MTNADMMALLHQTLAENLLARVKDPEAKSLRPECRPSVPKGQRY